MRPRQRKKDDRAMKIVAGKIERIAASKYMVKSKALQLLRGPYYLERQLIVLVYAKFANKSAVVTCHGDSEPALSASSLSRRC